jgi:hypothetical protein
MKACFSYSREEVHQAILEFHNKKFATNCKAYSSRVEPVDGDGSMRVNVWEKPKEERLTAWDEFKAMFKRKGVKA